MAATDSYRMTTENKVDSSSEEGELSSDEDGACHNSPLLTTESHSDVAMSSTIQPGQRRKPNNIWGSVIADQTTNDISSSLGVVGSQSIMSRGPESFSLELALKDIGRRHDGMQESSSEDEVPSKMMKTETIEEEMENYMIERHHYGQKKAKNARNNNLKRKKPKKNKPGNVPTYKPGQRITLNKRNEISMDDSEDKVAEEIIFRLWEKKRDLVKAVVRCIGVPRTIFLFNKTEAVELSGGLMTLQGTRRRTPGGTFFYLLRNDSEVNQDEVNALFEADYQREREQWLAAKQAKKQNKETIVDVGQTPQNSPQMETVHLTSENSKNEPSVDTIEEEMDDCYPDEKVNDNSPPSEDRKTPDIETFG